MFKCFPILPALGACCALTSPAFSETSASPFRYTGLCEASAAAVLSQGLFAVASDDLDKLERPKKDSLAVYRLGTPAPLFWTEDLGKLTDIEAAARIGAHHFWLASHSKADQKKRNKLFVTHTPDPARAPEEIGKKYKDLRQDLARVIASTAALGLNAAQVDAALNIEGMSSAAADTLLVGLRAPLSAAGDAIVVNIGQPYGLLDLPRPEGVQDAPARYARALDLGGRGIRGMTRLGMDPGYLIIAGASAKTEADFALFYWDGRRAPHQIMSVDFQDLNPEALIVWPDGTVQILGDNGGAHCSDNPKDGNTNPPWFPSITLKVSDLLEGLPAQ